MTTVEVTLEIPSRSAFAFVYALEQAAKHQAEVMNDYRKAADLQELAREAADKLEGHL